MKRLTDKKAIKVALHLAIDVEESLIDAYSDVPKDDPLRKESVGRAQRNIDAFKRVLDRYFGGHKRLVVSGKAVSLVQVLKDEANP